MDECSEGLFHSVFTGRDVNLLLEMAAGLKTSLASRITFFYHQRSVGIYAKEIHRKRLSSDKSINLIEISMNGQKRKAREKCWSMMGGKIRLRCVLYFDESLEGNQRDAQYRINVIYFMSEKSAFHFDFVSR